MNPKLQNVLLIIIIVLLIGGGVIIFFQQKTINKMEAFLPSSNQNDLKAADFQQPSSDTVAEAVKNDTIDNTMGIIGKIIQIGSNSLTVEANIFDLSGPIETDETNGGGVVPASSTPKIQKNYKITIDDKTDLSDKKIEDLKVGDSVAVQTKEPVYKTTDLTAVKIVYPVKTGQ